MKAMKAMMYPRGTCYHEAGHTVVRHIIGMEGLAVEVLRDQSGKTHGTMHILALRDQYDVWDHIVYILAGIYAEARATRQSAALVTLLGGQDDRDAALVPIRWLVAGGLATDEDAAWRRAEHMTRVCIRREWPRISAVAERLRVSGRLEAAEVAELLNGSGSD